MDTCICMAESLHWSPETITRLLTGYTPIQNKKLKRKKKKQEGDDMHPCGWSEAKIAEVRKGGL